MESNHPSMDVISDQGNGDDKILNINKGNNNKIVEDSSRGEMISKEGENTKESKPNELSQSKSKEEKKSTKKKSSKTKKSQSQLIDEKEEKNKEDEKKDDEGKKDGEKEGEEKKEGEKEGEDKKEGEEEIQETITNKIKFPIVPYKVSENYTYDLMNQLKKDNKTRPKTLFDPERDDITRDISTLDAEEKEKLKLDKMENLNVESKEREEKIYMTKYKETSLTGQTMLQDPMALFYNAEKVYLDQFYKISDLFVICPLYFNYRISLEYCTSDPNAEQREYTAYHLFDTKEISPSCSHNCCANQAREININIYNYILNPIEKNKPIQKFLSVKKECRCAFSCFCACCSRPTFLVETPVELLGKIIETRTACDPILNIVDINNDVIYVIKTSCSNCGYCCRDQCCDNRKCASLEFIICDGAQENNLGVIRKDHRSGKKIKPDYDQLEVVFPPEASCQEKIMLMCAALVVEYLYFQNLTNSKRCDGRPRFANISAD